MGMTIIVKSTDKQRYGIVRTTSQAARSRVSRENRQEYDNEKRALEIDSKMPCGHPDAKAVAIAKMMSVPESSAKRWLGNKKNSKVILDGKID